jgi:hypothetical protein
MINLGFLLREKTCCCAHHTFRLEFPNWLAIIIINYTPDIKHQKLWIRLKRITATHALFGKSY